MNSLITESVKNQLDGHVKHLLDEIELHHQQDGVPPHYILPVLKWLDNVSMFSFPLHGWDEQDL